MIHPDDEQYRVQFDANKIVFGSRSSLFLWDIRSDSQTLKVDCPPIARRSRVNQLQFDQRHLVLSRGSSIDVFDFRFLNEPVYVFEHLSHGQVTQFQFDGYKLISLGDERTLRVWSLRNGEAISVIPTVFLPQPSCFQHDWRQILVGSENGSLHRLDLRHRNEEYFRGSLSVPPGMSSSEAFFQSLLRHSGEEFVQVTCECQIDISKTFARLLVHC